METEGSTPSMIKIVSTNLQSLDNLKALCKGDNTGDQTTRWSHRHMEGSTLGQLSLSRWPHAEQSDGSFSLTQSGVHSAHGTDSFCR